MPSVDPKSRTSSGSPVAEVGSVLKDDPLMRQRRNKLKKRAKPWELSDDESEGARERKRKRVGDKQVRYAYVAHKFPTQCKAKTKEKSVAYYESATDGQAPTRRAQKWEPHRTRPSPLALTDLEYVRELGAGSYGCVGVVRVRERQHKHPDDVCHAELAVKSILKRKIREMEPLHTALFARRVEDEKNFERGNLFQLPWHPFIAGMYDCLADSRNLYMLQELGSLGTLDAYIDKHAPLPASVAQFYFANIAVALEFLASQKFVHGDLKPSNILIGANGYLLLADFGLASRSDETRDWELLGTHNYMSPEVTRGALSPGAAQALDWWSAACILFEMATGMMAFDQPEIDDAQFRDQDAVNEDVQMRVAAAHYAWPPGVRVDPRLKRLVDDMLVWDRAERLGAVCKRLDCETEKVVNVDVRCHPWFEGYPWSDIEARTYVPPYLPLHTLPATETWHTRRMPAQAQMPGLPQVLPPKHLEWDTRMRHWHRADEDEQQSAAASRAAQQAAILEGVLGFRKQRVAWARDAREKQREAAAAPSAADAEAVVQDNDAGHPESEAKGTEGSPDGSAPEDTPATLPSLSQPEAADGAEDETEDADAQDLEIVPVSSIPRTIVAGALPLFRPPTVKPRVFPPRTPSPEPSPPPPPSLPGAVPTIQVTTAELVQYGASQKWTVPELALRIARWKREADGRGGLPTRLEARWEAKRLRVLLGTRADRLDKLKPILAGTYQLPAHAMGGIRAQRAAAAEEERRLAGVLDALLAQAAAQGWTLRECAVMAVGKAGVGTREYTEKVYRFEEHLHRHAQRRGWEAPQAGADAAQAPVQEDGAAGESNLAGWVDLQGAMNVAGLSTAAPAQEQPFARPLANGMDSGSRAASAPAVQPVAGPSNPGKVRAAPQLMNGSSGPSLGSQPPRAGPSRIVKGPVPQSVLGSSKVVEIRKGPASQPVAGPSGSAGRGVQAMGPRQMANGSQPARTQQRTVTRGPPPPIPSAPPYEPYPAHRPRNEPIGATQPPTMGCARVHGPSGHAISQPDKRGVAASHGGPVQRAGPPKDTQVKAGTPTQNTSSASPDRASSPLPLGPLPPLPRTPPGQIFKLDNPPKVTPPSPPSGAGAVAHAGPRPRPRVHFPTRAEEPGRQGRQGDDALERIWSQRSPEPTPTSARAPRPPSAGAVGPRVRAGSPTRPERAQVAVAGAEHSGATDRRAGPAKRVRSLVPFESYGSSEDEEEDTPTKPKVPPASQLSAASRLRAPVFSPPLSPTAAAGSPSGSVMGSPPRWSP